MDFQQLIAKKIKLNGLAGIQNHMLDRDKVKTNPDIDLTRSHLNYSIENLTAEHLNSRVKARIKQLNLKKKFTGYCHDVNRATVRTFIATRGN